MISTRSLLGIITIFISDFKRAHAGPHPSHRTRTHTAPTSMRSTTTMTTSTATTTSPTVLQGLRPRGRPLGPPLEVRRGRLRGPRREVRRGALLRISKRISGIALAAQWLVAGHLYVEMLQSGPRDHIFCVKRLSFLIVR